MASTHTAHTQEKDDHYSWRGLGAAEGEARGGRAQERGGRRPLVLQDAARERRHDVGEAAGEVGAHLARVVLDVVGGLPLVRRHGRLEAGVMAVVGGDSAAPLVADHDEERAAARQRVADHQFAGAAVAAEEGAHGAVLVAHGRVDRVYDLGPAVVEDAARGIDGLRLGAGQVEHQVHHVAALGEDLPAALDRVLRPAGFRPDAAGARVRDDVVRLGDLALHVFGAHGEAAAKRHHVLHAGALLGREDVIALLLGHRHRLLDEDVLALLHGAQREGGVRVVPGGDHHRVYVGVAEDAFGVIGDVLALVGLPMCLGALQVHVGQPAHFDLLRKRAQFLGDAGQCAPYRVQVDLAHTATADNAQSYLVHGCTPVLKREA